MHIYLFIVSDIAALQVSVKAQKKKIEVHTGLWNPDNT